MSTNATTTTIQKVACPVSTAAPSSASAAAPAASAAIIRRLRSKRSAATPAGALRITSGRNSTAPTYPVFAAECVNASVSSGYAIPEIPDPNVESSSPL